MLSNFNDNLNVVVIGASGGIGRAFVEFLSKNKKVKTIHAFSRSDIHFENSKIQIGKLDLNDEKLIEASATLASKGAPLDIVIIATGLLHRDTVQPEKSLKDIDAENFSNIFYTNSIGPALIMKYFLPKLSRERKTVFAVLSARVGSISDNHLGGWYAYRSSKSALNMLIKTASIEVARKYKQASVIGLHPGTVETPLSEPFRNNVSYNKLFTPEFSVNSLIKVINDVNPEQTGQVFAWDGTILPN